MNNLLEAALQYRSIGLSVIPLSPKSKIPPKGFSPIPYREKLATEDEIRQWWTENQNYNVGIITGKLSNLFVIDLDKHDKAYNEEIVMQYIPDSISCPVVNTPNGGQHLYFVYPEEEITIGSRFIPGCDYRGEGGYIVAPPSVNGNGKPYEWYVKYDTSATLGRPPKAALDKIIKSTLYRGKVDSVWTTDENGKTQESTKTTSVHIFNKGTRDENLFHIAHTLAKTGSDEEYVRQVLQALLRSWGEVDDKWIEVKVKSAFDRKNRKERNIAAEIKEYILEQKCLHEVYISSTSCLQSLQLSTREEKKAAYIALARLCDNEKLIEKHGDRRGEYRIVDNEKEKARMDLVTESEIHEFPVKLPLDLNEMCVVSPGNIIVVSGSKSSGKTALMMNLAWANQDRMDVVYLNSEMHETEFKKRMKKFAPLSKWKIAGYKCHNNFDDYIEGGSNRIYIVDYLEVHDNFYEIAKPIRKIHEKLGDAICVIGIQMKSGASLGRGGDFSAEKARLYLTMDYNHEEKRTKVTIYDAKEPRPPFDNVRGKWRHVKIIDGHRLSSFSEWQW